MMLSPDIVVPISGMLMVASLGLGIPLIRALSKRWERESEKPRIPDDVSERLAHMEQAIDAIAIEVERIAEGQRFTTKLLAERERAPAQLPESSELSR